VAENPKEDSASEAKEAGVKTEAEDAKLPEKEAAAAVESTAEGSAHPEQVSATAEEKGENAPAGEEEGSEDADEEDDDAAKATQEGIARRVAALGEEDDVERLARLEEEKLAERRRRERQAKGKGKKKGGLEAAASKRLAKIGTKAPPPKRAVAMAVDADPLIEKTAQLSKWVKKNQKGVGVLVAAAVLAGAVFGGYVYMQGKREGDASVTLATAVADERGRIGDPAKEEEDSDGPKDPRPLFKTTADRREAALTKYREVESKFAGTGAAYLARLGEGSLLLDKEEPDAAIAAFNDAKDSPLAKVDAEVHGRALEGLGFAYEIKAQKANGDEKTKWLDEALKPFHELESTDALGFKELGMYHQARVYEEKGDKDRAKELLKTVYERTSKPGENQVFPYLEQYAEDRLRSLDPSALPPKSPMAGMGGLGGMMGGNNKLTDAQRRAIQEAMRKAQQQHGAPPGGGAP